MENTDRICGNCGYWCFDESSPDRFYGICYHFSWTDGHGSYGHARTETCSGFSSRFVRPPSPGIYQDPHLRIRDLENELDRLATRRAQLEHVHLADLDEIDTLRGHCERQAAEISIQSNQLLKMSEHLNESFKQRDQARTELARMTDQRNNLQRSYDDLLAVRDQRDQARAQVDDLSTEVVKMNEEIRQLRGMIH